MNRLAVAALVCSLVPLSAAVRAQPAPSPPSPLRYGVQDAAAAGPDFAVQGEYVGAVGGSRARLAAQIVAQGDGRFAAAMLRGGFPGAGWDGKPPVRLTGATAGSATTLSGAGWQADIAAGALTGRTDAGERFTLKRVERHSPTEGAKPPAGAIVLFDGTDVKEWSTGQMDEQGLLWTVLPPARREELKAAGRGNPGQPATRRKLRDISLHLEFRNPFMPYGRGQGRGNSGVYLQGRYEIQVLDSFGVFPANPQPVGDICGEIYRQVTCPVNACLPPLAWQTYDIDFRAPRFDAAGNKTENARVSVRLNGVALYTNQEVIAKTGHGQPEGPDARSLILQDHGNPTVFRNVWIVAKEQNAGR